ncbi:putative short chain oxidoreductase/dehydrogenase [Bisporella sp. PMI_857]|nr:putative short chain oxidoreductase/dehydrogenase [Bisporella sp. PMI_857]
MSSSPVWFITGCSSGFGAALALLALKNGHRVIATSRNPSKSADLVSQVEGLGGKWLALDICGADVESVVEEATKIYGRIDILVNNAGYCLLGAFESFSDHDCRAEIEVNLFAPMHLTRLILPSMRARKSGTIINISSAAGIRALPSRTLYSASKFAIEGFSEALRGEVQPLGIRVLLVEPGAFRTPFAANLILGEKETPTEYAGTVTEQILQLVKDMASGENKEVKMMGDVEKGVQAIWDVVMKTGQAEGMEEFLRLPLGKDGSASWEHKINDLKRNLDGTKHIWMNTDHDG